MIDWRAAFDATCEMALILAALFIAGVLLICLLDVVMAIGVKAIILTLIGALLIAWWCFMYCEARDRRVRKRGDL